MDLLLNQVRALYKIKSESSIEKDLLRLSKQKKLNLDHILQQYPSIVRAQNKDNVCKVFAFYALKGGVGKTTLSQHYAKYLAYQGLSTLVVPLDSTQNMTNLLLQSQGATDLSQENSIFSFTLKCALGEEPTVTKTAAPNLFILPEKDDMTNDIPILHERVNSIRRNRGVSAVGITDLFQEVTLPVFKEYFDAIIFDMNPGRGALSENAIKICDTVIIPTLSGIKDISSLENTVNFIGKVNSSSMIKIVMNRYLDNQYNLELEDFIHQEYSDCELLKIPEGRKTVLKADSEGSDVFISSPRSKFSNKMIEFCNHIWASTQKN